MKRRTRTAALAGLFVAATAAPAVAGPDFITPDRSVPLAASDAQNEEQPQDDLVFAYDSAVLSPTGKTQLESVAKWLQVHPHYRLVLEGRADSSGPAAYNADLANRRLEITRDQLAAFGVASDRILLALYGENGARVPADRVDHRVVMFASRAPLSTLVSTELDRSAIETSWTLRGSIYRESRGITPVMVAAPVRNRPADRHGG
jgi:outer membrane protein OmpA-like peptidoglycan-associated protein